MDFVPILMTLFQADAFVSICVARSQWSWVCQQPLGMAPLFLAAHQVFYCGHQQLLCCGWQEETPTLSSLGWCEAERHRAALLPLREILCNQNPLVAPATEMRVRWHSLSCWGWLFVHNNCSEWPEEAFVDCSSISTSQHLFSKWSLK